MLLVDVCTLYLEQEVCMALLSMWKRSSCICLSIILSHALRSRRFSILGHGMGGTGLFLLHSMRCIAAAINDVYDNVISMAYRALIDSLSVTNILHSLCKHRLQFVHAVPCQHCVQALHSPGAHLGCG